MRRNDWYTVEEADHSTFIISEYRHWEQTHCYLLLGSERALLIDTGLGVEDISKVVSDLTALPVAVVTTHVHWDHIGGHRHYPEFYIHGAEFDWIHGAFPLPVNTVRAMLQDRCTLPEGFDLDAYELFQGEPAGLLQDGDMFELGGRSVQVFHTPGHSPGHLCVWEAERGWLFSGDLVYSGTLYANYPSTDPEAYLRSLEKLEALPVRRMFPGHHDLCVSPGLISEIRNELSRLRELGKLCHGSGRYDYGTWSIML